MRNLTSVSHVEKTEASGCTYWRRAAEGKTFYTEAADHYNCPIGCYTHNVESPDAQMAELENTLGLMGELGYISMEEVPGIPRRETPFNNCSLLSAERMQLHDRLMLSSSPARRDR